jgi:hypothetical protein
MIDRVQRAKDARLEATKEIENIKAQKNAEYQNFVAQVCLFFFFFFGNYENQYVLISVSIELWTIRSEFW